MKPDPNIAAALADLVQLLPKLPAESRELVIPAMTLLSEVLAIRDEKPDEYIAPATDSRLERLVALEQQMHEYPASERGAIVRERMNLKRSTYYRLRTQAQELGLL